eukprot:g1445.t1
MPEPCRAQSGGLGKRANETSVGTVFSMQGSERHFILLSFVRSIAEGWALKNLAMQGSDKEIRVAVTSHNPALRQTFESHIGIAAKANLLNVALTRAKSGLVIVGNRTVLSEALRQLVQLGSAPEADVVAAVDNLDKKIPSSEWLWAAVAQFLGLVDGADFLQPAADYALASQLASDGHAEGIAAKAEMLYYGKSAVVPGGSTGRGWIVFPLLVLAAWVLPKLLGGREVGAGSPPTRLRIGGCLRAMLLLAAFGFWWSWRSARPGDLAADTAQAQELFQEAADAGHWGAAYAYALLKLEENESEAEPYLTQVVEQGEAPACFLAEFLMYRHHLRPSDPVKEKQLLKKAADLGDPMAANLLAERLSREDWGDAIAVALAIATPLDSMSRAFCHQNVCCVAVQTPNVPSPPVLAECSPQARPAHGTRTARRCAAHFWARAAEHPLQIKANMELPQGSALLEASSQAAMAAAAAGRHFEWLGELDAAVAWNCAAGRMKNHAGRPGRPGHVEQ